MRLSFLPEQLVRSSEQLVLVDTKKKVFRPWIMLLNRQVGAPCNRVRGEVCSAWHHVFQFSHMLLTLAIVQVSTDVNG